MVSDFVEELQGLIKLTDAEFEREITQIAQLLLTHGAENEGYWTWDHLMKQAGGKCGK